ncbi:hypothetical protein PUR34_13615, partial [Streptomyces sp. JV185]
MLFVSEGTVTRWLKEVGEEVTEDAPHLEDDAVATRRSADPVRRLRGGVACGCHSGGGGCRGLDGGGRSRGGGLGDRGRGRGGRG